MSKRNSTTIREIHQKTVSNDRGGVLIVGSDGQIGSALLEHLKTKKFKVDGTSRKQKVAQDKLFFDMAEPKLNIKLHDYDCVILCAAMTSINECEQNVNLCEKINLLNTITLIEQCVSSKVFVVFLSSIAVFDGKKPFYKYTDPTNPITKYGSCKAAVEDYILKQPANAACVLRLTKVITPQTPFIQSWRDNAAVGQEIKAFSNCLLSPLGIGDVIASIELLIEQKVSGVFQLGINEEISFYQYAREIFAKEPDMLKRVVATKAEDPVLIRHNSLTTHLPLKKIEPTFI